MNIEQALAMVPDGWTELVSDAFGVADDNNFQIISISERNGALNIRNKGNLKTSAYYQIRMIEEKSQNCCMHCGQWGKRRQYSMILCEKCNNIGYALLRHKTIETIEL